MQQGKSEGMAEIAGGAVVEKGKKKIEELKGMGFGVVGKGKMALSFEEALYLLEKGKIKVKGAGSKELRKRGAKQDSRFNDMYLLFKLLRGRGYVVRPGVEKGIYRLYERGVLPGEDRARTVIRLVDNGWKATAGELTEAIELAHGLRKRFVFAFIGKDGKPMFFELRKRDFW